MMAVDGSEIHHPHGRWEAGFDPIRSHVKGNF